MVDLQNAVWVKASRSTATGEQCVEVAGLGKRVAIRDSKHPEGHVIVLPAAQWQRLRGKVRQA